MFCTIHHNSKTNEGMQTWQQPFTCVVQAERGWFEARFCRIIGPISHMFLFLIEPAFVLFCFQSSGQLETLHWLSAYWTVLFFFFFFFPRTDFKQFIPKNCGYDLGADGQEICRCAEQDKGASVDLYSLSEEWTLLNCL